MEKEEDIRYFLIEHKACKSDFTINSHTFVEPSNNIIRCPNCNEPIFESRDDISQLIDFLRAYKYLLKLLDRQNATIKEIALESTPSK